MKIYSKFRINILTYLFFLICAFCGYLKNIIIIFIICLIHELGHIFFIKLFKYNLISIEIFPFGGYTTIDKKINSNLNKDLIISLGGILFQLLLFIILVIFKDYFNLFTYNLFLNYNLILIIFNILPIIPLDGNNLLKLLLEKYLSFSLSYQINYIISIIFLIIFIIINYYYNIDNYFIIIFLIIKLIEYIYNYKFVYNRFLLERYLYKFPYKRINNHTKSINSLRKDVYHYFKNKNKYINEHNKIKEIFNK